MTAPPTERSEFVEELLDVEGVVNVHEMLTGQRNIYVEVVGTSKSDVTRMTDEMHDLGLQIDSSDIVKQRHDLPFDHFHPEGEPDDEPVDGGDE